MAIKIISTQDVQSDGVKLLIYSLSGVGKTTLCSTAPGPIIISAEAGLLSLAEFDIPVIEVTNNAQVNDAYRFLTEAEERKNFKTICLDSITEIGEVMLIEYKANVADARQAYGQLNDDMASTIRAFRDIKGMHVYFTAKLTRIEADDMPVRFLPAMPGKTLLNSLSYFFDEVLPLRIGQLEDGTTYRYLQSYPTLNYEAKDRSGRLPPRTKPDLTDLFERISTGQHLGFSSDIPDTDSSQDAPVDTDEKETDSNGATSDDG